MDTENGLLTRYSYWGNPDTRHVNARGHHDLGMLVASLIRDSTCQMLAEGEIENLYDPSRAELFSATLQNVSEAQMQDQQLAMFEAKLAASVSLLATGSSGGRVCGEINARNV